MPAPTYPPIEPYDFGTLAVGDGHTLAYEQCGNPRGKPAVFLHGGPGGGSRPSDRCLWDPAAYRIVLFDQRGAGRSRPHAETAANTTWHLVADLERLREHLGLTCWQVLGGSWGSTLGLAYAQAFPHRVTELVLRGIFLVRAWEVDWFYQAGASRIFPDAWAEFVALVPRQERHDLLSAYHRRLVDPRSEVHLPAAQAWSRWEGATSRLVPDAAHIARHLEPAFALALARIECHYFRHGAFMASDAQLLDNASVLGGLPGTVVHGRYDVVCPLQNAFDLAAAWPGAELVVVPDAGHSLAEPAIARAVVAATDRYRG